MISVRNPLPPLSGNSVLWSLFLCCLIFFSSCEMFRKVEKPDRKNDDIDVIEGKVIFPDRDTSDVVIDPVPDPEDPDPVDPLDPEEPKDGEYTYLSTYNIAILLPFLTNKFDPGSSEVYEKSKLALSFYEGVKLALDSLEKRGLNLNVTVVDTKVSESEVANLLQRPELQEAHVVIGPYVSKNIKMVADWALENNKIHLSPFSPSETIVSENPNYVQLIPSLSSHCEAILRHALRKYEADQIVLVCREKEAESNRLDYFQNAYKRIREQTFVNPLSSFIVKWEEEDYQEIEVGPYLKQDEATVFLIPSWSSQAFVYAFLRNISLEMKDQEVVIYGMPQWMTFDLPNYDYYEALNIHVSSSFFLEEEEKEVRKFKRTFFSAYGELPNQESVRGADVIWFLGDMLDQYGISFLRAIEREKKIYLHNAMSFSKVPLSEPDVELKPRAFKQFENKHVYILKFQDYYFQEAY